MDLILNHDEDEEDVMEENTSKATRGPASLDKVRKCVNLSVEFDPVTFSPLGVSGTSCNWVGLETRTFISILFEDWKKVEEVQKDQLWSAIQKHWNIPNDENTLQIKKSTLKIANTSWRNFKKHLILKFMRKGKIPFLKYKFIKEETWNDFCRLKSTRKFTEKSEIGKERVKLNKNPHRLGSRGYLGKKDQWAKEKEEGKCPELFSLSTERARDFLLARRVKVGPDKYELPKNLLTLANQIIEKECLKPGEDSLVAVMGKDHPGCTRGVSHNVGVRTTLPNLACKRRKQEDIESLKRTMESQNERLEHMQEQIQMILSQQNSSSGSPGMRLSSAGSATCLEWATGLEKPTQCELIHGLTRLACAKGVVHPIGNGILHGVPMMAGCIKVQVDMVYDGFGDVDMPVHNEEMETLKDANGAYIQWPQNDVVLHSVSNRNVAKPAHMIEKSPSRQILKSAPSQVQNEDLEAHSEMQKLPKKSKVKQSIGFKMPTKMLSRPQELQKFYVRLNSNDEWRRNGVTVEVDKGVLGVERMLITLSYDDLYELLRNGWLESGIIAAFMSGLHLVLSQKARSNRCAFLHPDSISGRQIQASPSHVTDLIYEAFTISHNKNKEFFIAPYIDGDHWLLLLVLPKFCTVYVMDSTHEQSKRKPESYQIKSVLDKAILKYNSLTCPNVCVGPVTWIITECNQQSSTWECGYYVCKWLFHFVMEQQYTFPNSTPWKKRSFTAAEVDGIAVSIVNRLSINYFKT